MAKVRWARNRATVHLHWLAHEHGVTIRWMPPGRMWTYAWAHPGTMLVEIPKPYNPRLYMVCLHEFGHVVSPLARELWDRAQEHEAVEGEPGDLSTAIEGAAWGWAFDHADVDLLRALTQPDFEWAQYGIVEHLKTVVAARRLAQC